MRSSVADLYVSLVLLQVRSAELASDVCDSFIEVKLGNGGNGSFTHRTKIVAKSRTPRYDDTMKFLVRESERKYPLLLNVYMKSMLFHQELIGTSELSLADLSMGMEHVLSLPIKRISTNTRSDMIAGKVDVSLYMFNRDEMETNFWKQLLTAFDKDQNQSIDRDELAALVYAIGGTLSHEQLEQLMQEVYGSEETQSLSIDQIAAKLKSRTLKSFTSTRSKLLAAPSATRPNNSNSSSSALLSSTPSPGRSVSPKPNQLGVVAESRSPQPAPPSPSPLQPSPSPVPSTDYQAMAAAVISHLSSSSSSENPTHTSAASLNVSSVALEEEEENDELLWRAQLLAKDPAHVRDLVTKERDRLKSQAHSLNPNDSARKSEPHRIIVQDRESGKLMEEKMPDWLKTSLRAMYSTSSGRYLIRGQKMKQLLKSMTESQRKKFIDPKSKKEIPEFIKFHNLNVNEILDPLASFQNFNDFFIRKLRADARPVFSPEDPLAAVCPADCRLHVFASLEDATRLWIKGSHFTLASLLGSQQLADEYQNCSLVIARLAPQDYHRYHSPVDASVGEFRWFETGVYYTVNPIAIREDVDVFTVNKRTIVPLESPDFGKVMWISVGATMVGSVNFTKATGDQIRKGEEFGFFAFGGSTVLILFKANTIRFDKDLLLNSQKQMETLVKVGQSLGRCIRQQKAN